MYWMVSLPYQGIATIAIELKDDDKKPTMNDFRRHLQMQEVDMGVPIFKTQNPEIESIDQDMYKRIKKFMDKKSIKDIATEIIKIASLTGKQQEQIKQFYNSNPQISFQELSKFLSKKINVKESIIYDFLVTSEKKY